MPTLHLLVRNHFVDLPEAMARRVADNAWEITVPLDEPVLRRARRGDDPNDWDGAIFLVDDAETQPAVVSGVLPGAVRLSAWVLD